jgi:hypothetical protein
VKAPVFHTHTGICDASAALFLKRGATRFLVAGDEDQQQTVLRMYDAGTDGPPIQEFRLSNAALVPDAEEPEIDLEGSAWVGNRMFWIGSHSRSKKGKSRPSRHRLFATTLKKNRLEIDGQPYSTLVKDLAAKLNLNIDKKLPPKDGGLSIEGLSSTPNDGELLIAFRSPLVKKKALLITLKNADAIVDHGAPAEFGNPMLLDLGGFGIRSIDYWPERKAYYLITGPSGDNGNEFHLMRWSGPVSTRPESLDALDFAAMGIGDDEAPEGLLIEPESETIYLVFDEGNRITNGVKCKDSDDQSFRSVSISFS